VRESGLAGLLRSKNSQNRTHGLMREGRREPALYSTLPFAASAQKARTDTQIIIQSPLVTDAAVGVSSTRFIFRECCAARFRVCGAADKRYSLGIYLRRMLWFSS
jgi:hypothetical protein